MHIHAYAVYAYAVYTSLLMWTHEFLYVSNACTCIGGDIICFGEGKFEIVALGLKSLPKIKSKLLKVSIS